MKLSQINQAVEEKVLDRFPGLVGYVTFDTQFHAASSMATIFYTTVSVNDHKAYQHLRDTTPEPSCRWMNESTHVLRELLCYQADENNRLDFPGTHMMIGDGDDSGAVWENGSYDMVMWVRILELSQDDYANEE